jgi:hypothetical protein
VLHLVEISPVLRAQQERTLSGLPVNWHASSVSCSVSPMPNLASSGAG